MIGEQNYYEAKVFLKNYHDALNTLEYEHYQHSEVARNRALLAKYHCFENYLVNGSKSGEVVIVIGRSTSKVQASGRVHTSKKAALGNWDSSPNHYSPILSSLSIVPRPMTKLRSLLSRIYDRLYSKNGIHPFLNFNIIHCIDLICINKCQLKQSTKPRKAITIIRLLTLSPLTSKLSSKWHISMQLSRSTIITIIITDMSTTEGPLSLPPTSASSLLRR